jgi:hypothetical protein
MKLAVPREFKAFMEWARAPDRWRFFPRSAKTEMRPCRSRSQKIKRIKEHGRPLPEPSSLRLAELVQQWPVLGDRCRARSPLLERRFRVLHDAYIPFS